jgi:hypothetical protein
VPVKGEAEAAAASCLLTLTDGQQPAARWLRCRCGSSNSAEQLPMVVVLLLLLLLLSGHAFPWVDRCCAAAC